LLTQEIERFKEFNITFHSIILPLSESISLQKSIHFSITYFHIFVKLFSADFGTFFKKINTRQKARNHLKPCYFTDELKLTKKSKKNRKKFQLFFKNPLSTRKK